MHERKLRMTVNDLYMCCTNITTNSEVQILDNDKQFVLVMSNAFFDIYYRKVDWFRVEDGVVVIKLKREG